ncbi:MAG: hypothetical protein ACRBBQ_17750 [Cognatishimia sp.]
MSIENTPQDIRTADFFHHIDMGFLNRRLAITALGSLRDQYLQRVQSGSDHMTVLRNDHLLVTILIDAFNNVEVPTLAEALTSGRPKSSFMSIERLESCPEIYTEKRVSHEVHLEIDVGKPVSLSYHTKHMVADTGTMTLSEGYQKGYYQAVIGVLHDKVDRFEIEPIVIGAPWLDHPRNYENGVKDVMWYGQSFGELLPEDIEEFSKLRETKVESASEWMSVMQKTPEEYVKQSIAKLLTEPTKADWGGEENDHFSANTTVAGRRRTAAFLLKGPTKFKEMTPAMCGKNGDQIYRLVRVGADISVVQHSHLIGTAVRETLKSMVVQPGNSGKFCLMDGQATYRLLKAYDLLPA